MVEIAIAFPVIIILLSGVVEFGFMINYYLSLLDATRESARFYSNLDPFNDDLTDNMSFYSGASAMVIDRLRGIDPGNPLIELDLARDDVIITAYSLDVDAFGVPTLISYPSGGPFHQTNNQPSAFSDTEILNTLTAGGDPLVDSGILLVEVWWGYDEVLDLPWLDPFLPEPVMLHAYSIMPLIAAEPVDP
jgi:hypothetical protein